MSTRTRANIANIISSPSTPVKVGRKTFKDTKNTKDVLDEIEDVENQIANVSVVTPLKPSRRRDAKKQDSKVEKIELPMPRRGKKAVVEVVQTIAEVSDDDEPEEKPSQPEEPSEEQSEKPQEEEQEDKASNETEQNAKCFGRGQRISILPQVKKVYQMVNQMTGTLGGNGYNGAIYGELTVGSMQRVINILVDQCEMDHTSRFIDVGSGLGKPNLHAAQSPGVRLSLGIELETIRWQLAMHNLSLFLSKYRSQSASVPVEDRINGGVNFIVGDIDNASSLDPFTHIYMYDLGFPPPLQQSIARKFNSSVHARYLVSYRPPRRVMKEYGYNVELVTSVITSMFGSGEGHTAYFYKRTGEIPSSPVLQNQRSLVIPKRTDFRETESDEEVHCDAAFYDAVYNATNDFDALFSATKAAVDEHLNSGRSKRTTRASARHMT